MIKKKRVIKPASPTVKKKTVSSAPTAMEYISLFDTCEIKKEKIGEIDKLIDEKLTINMSRYQGISNTIKSGGTPQVSALTPEFQLNYIPFYKRFGTPAPADTSNFSPNNFFNKTPSVFQGLNQGTQSLLPGLSQLNYIDGNNSLFNKDIFSGTSFYSSGAGIPWYFIACVHYLECSLSFKKHLHNGDPLTGYTVHVPAHRPKVGHPPPFTFEESAFDALKLMKYDQVTNWSLPFILQKLEGYNGFGYNKRGVHTPYLWSYSNHYTKGKYVKDGVFDANAVSSQLGAAVILKRMEQRGLISIPRN